MLLVLVAALKPELICTRLLKPRAAIEGPPVMELLMMKVNLSSTGLSVGSSRCVGGAVGVCCCRTRKVRFCSAKPQNITVVCLCG
jgi:hypothetical protein